MRKSSHPRTPPPPNRLERMENRIDERTDERRERFVVLRIGRGDTETGDSMEERSVDGAPAGDCPPPQETLEALDRRGTSA